jgi:hypothetical protein
MRRLPLTTNCTIAPYPDNFINSVPAHRPENRRSVFIVRGAHSSGCHSEAGIYCLGTQRPELVAPGRQVQPRHASAVHHRSPPKPGRVVVSATHWSTCRRPQVCISSVEKRSRSRPSPAIVMSASYEIEAATSPVGPCQLITPRVREPRASTPRRNSSMTSSVSAPSTSRPLDGAMGALPASLPVFI